MCMQIEAHLNITPGWLQTASAKELSRLNLVPEGEDTGFQWTETSTALPPIAKLEVDPLRGSDSQAEVAQKVKEESQSYVAPTDRPSQDETVRIEEGVVKTGAESDFAEQGTDGPRDVGADDQPKEGDGDRQEPVDSQEGKKEGLSSDLNGLRSEGHEINAVQKGDNVSEGPKTKHRRWICGEEALNIAHCDPYVLRRPIRRGRLNVSKSYPLQQVKYLVFASNLE